LASYIRNPGFTIFMMFVMSARSLYWIVKNPSFRTGEGSIGLLLEEVEYESLLKFISFLFLRVFEIKW
jgi:hypothetical protein